MLGTVCILGKEESTKYKNNFMSFIYEDLKKIRGRRG